MIDALLALVAWLALLWLAYRLDHLERAERAREGRAEDEEGTEMTYDFFQHMTSGDVFAVCINERGSIVGSVGPLHYSDLHNKPEDFAQNMEPWSNDDFLMGNDYRLLEANEALQMANR